MPENLFEQNLNNPAPEAREINEINEKEFLASTKKRNKKTLIRLDPLERERIAHKIKGFYLDAKKKHDDLEDDIDRYDEIYRMERDTRPGETDDAPNYRSPLSTVTLEVIHANEMNVFFTPKNPMRVLPTEAGDIPKVRKLETFGNWSMINEMDLFENCDKLFHASGKNGEAPYMVHWVKEYGTEIKIEPVMNPLTPGEPLLDPDTNEVITQERELEKLLYNGPKLEVFSRKDYIRPRTAVAGRPNDWDMRRLRMNADNVNRAELEGKFYPNAFDDIYALGAKGITDQEGTDNKTIDKMGDTIPLAPTEKMYVEFYGRLRIKAMKEDDLDGQDTDELRELEDEFIAIIELNSETLCSLRKNRFPLKMRPIGLDEFLPDDEGRKQGIGVMEFMDGIQKSFDSLHNQYMLGTIQSNSPIIFFTPMGNMRDEKLKLQAGYMYPTADPNSVREIKLSPPDQSLIYMMEQVRNFAQLLFGISDYSAGIESQIDPSAPAKKAELVVAQGNVRLNLIIKRKNKTLQDIFKRWFLLYQANMPPNKFMRIAGEDRNNPWKFEPINITDFALKSIPDFELTGNVLNANKTLEVQKALGIYQVLVTNPFFAPQTQAGIQALHALTKWLLDKFDEAGVSNFLPPSRGEKVQTPEEENARFLQGDQGEPESEEDHIQHIRIHSGMATDPTVPEDVRKRILEHIQKHVQMLKELITQQTVLGGLPSVQGQAGGGTPPSPQSFLQQPGMGGPQTGGLTGVAQR